jgi:hypothetical protein
MPAYIDARTPYIPVKTPAPFRPPSAPPISQVGRNVGSWQQPAWNPNVAQPAATLGVFPPGQQQPQTTPPPGTGGGGGGGATSADYTSDPILARIRALGAQRVTEAEANALMQKQRLAIGYGDPAFARKIGVDESFAKAAEANPFSTTKELARGKKRRDVFDINRPLSDYKNLFYSSERGRQLSVSGESYLRDQASAQSAVQQQLEQITQAVLQAKLQAQADEIAAEQAAYERALSRALG